LAAERVLIHARASLFLPVPRVWSTHSQIRVLRRVSRQRGSLRTHTGARRVQGVNGQPPNLTWLPPRTRAALRFGTGRGGCNDVQRERVRACVAFGTDARACSVVPSVPSFKGSAPHSPHGLLASGRAASAARLGCSEQRGSTSPLKVRPPPPLRNIERRGSETWAARRARRPKHGSITLCCS